MNERVPDFPPNEDLIPLADREFDYITGLVYERFGIHLPAQKRVLVSGRLTKRLRSLGCRSFGEYVRVLEADPTGEEVSEMMNLLTTNHSFFFRERGHFDFLAGTVLPELETLYARDPGYPLRIWSAGCASGEEVYSVAMILHDRYLGKGAAAPDIGLLATDISLNALMTAKAGTYQGQKFDEMPDRFKKRYFASSGDGEFSISGEIKSMVLFKRLNLMADSYPMRGQFDVVFCRNVMIYFNQESRDKVVSTIHDYVKPGGYLFIGHSESLHRDSNPFEYVMPAIYRKRPVPGRNSAPSGNSPTKLQGVNR